MGWILLFALELDGLVKTPKMASHVIPAKAGIQENKHFWTPAFAGVTALMTSCERIKLHHSKFPGRLWRRRRRVNLVRHSTFEFQDSNSPAAKGLHQGNEFQKRKLL
jgi:hypothetical protein